MNTSDLYSIFYLNKKVKKSLHIKIYEKRNLNIYLEHLKKQTVI